MRESVVFLSPERRRLDVVQARDIGTPGRLDSHFVEFRVLLNHRRDDSKECFIRREKACSSSEGVALQETLEG